MTDRVSAPVGAPVATGSLGWIADMLEAVLDWSTRSSRRALAILALVTTIVLLPGIFTIPAVDRDETRFAQATRQMVETGDYIDIRLRDEPRYKKPIGIYWMQAASVKIAGLLGVADAKDRIGFYRIPSLIGIVLAVLFTYWTARPLMARRAAFLAALMTGSGIVVAVEAHLAKTDAVQLAAIMAMMGVLLRAYLGRGGAERPAGEIALFWTALAIGILVKGPVPIMVFALTALVLSVLDRDAGWLKRLRPGIGLVWVFILVLPWLIAIAIASKGAFFTESVGKDLLGKVAQGQESHGAPPGYYLLTYIGTFWPAAMLTALAFPFIRRSLGERGTRFLLAWIIPTWLVMEAVPTKLPHYTMPLMPALAILFALAIDRRALPTQGWLPRLATSLWAILPAVFAVAVLIGVQKVEGTVLWSAIPVAVAMVLAGALAFALFRRAYVEEAVMTAFLASAALFLFFFGLVAPAMKNIWVAERFKAVAASLNCPDPRIAETGFPESSVAFVFDTRSVSGTPAEVAAALKPGGCALAFVDAPQDAAFRAAIAKEAVAVAEVTKLRVFNHTKGRWQTFTAYRPAN